MRLVITDTFKVTITFDNNVQPVGLNETKQVLAQLPIELNDLPQGEISVAVTSLGKIKQLNQRHANQPEATDVLSFDYREQAAGETSPEVATTLPLGEVVVSRDHVLKQAAQAETTEETEMALLVLHGILHLSGWDHATEAERESLDALQKKLMEKAGLKYRDFQWQK